MSGSDRIRFNCYAASVAMHVLLLILLPGLSSIAPVMSSPPIEVELIPFQEEIELGSTKIQPAESPNKANAEDEKKNNKKDTQSSASFSAPPLNLPKHASSGGEQPELSTQSLPGIEIPKQAGELIAPEIKPLEPSKIKDLQASIPEKPPEFAWLPDNRTSEAPRSEKATDSFAIEGPVAKRRVTYQPPPPEIITTSAVTLRLKFWVHPDGTVGRIVPLVRADAEIEKIAITFLEKWRFEPVRKDLGDQWGILPIQLKLQ